MIHLRSIALRTHQPLPASFPFDLPIIQGWQELTFTNPVTFLIGENGTGKSTLIEALAVAAEMVTVGSGSAQRDPTLAHVRELAKWLSLVWNKRTRRGFFLRAEDFFGYVKQQRQTKEDMRQELERVDREYKDRSKMAQDLARIPFASQLNDMQSRYGEGLDVRSHGESFLDLFQARFVPQGLYLLDEPEAPLSPLRQLALLSAIKEMTAQDGQFIIATHSPLLMAYPGATLLSFDQPPIRPVAYQDLEHVNLTRDFLNNPDAFLRHL